MNFTKMQGCGNDFVIVDGPAELTAARVRDLCDRRRGIGADGVLVVGAERDRCWPVAIHNADGSLGESCGNGARCVARYLLDRHGGDELELSFLGGDVKARRDAAGIAIAFAPPRSPQSIAVDGMRAYRVSLGNPHVVLFVADPATADLPALAASARQAAGHANVEIARVVAPDLILLRVDERGVGETLACGTGALGAVAVAVALGEVDALEVRVRLPGGTLLVRPGPDRYELAGPAEYVFRGELAS
ncbi:MAG TPA: diaminopimelate epimerase [Candidatus Bathyarchaeia archaeon]|nr:diaminopimelate epimerase [Candidatus Bathyarchaeia archaeon]